MSSFRRNLSLQTIEVMVVFSLTRMRRLVLFRLFSYESTEQGSQGFSLGRGARRSSLPPFQGAGSCAILWKECVLLKRRRGVLMSKRLLPTGTCWCGCGAETARGSFFLPGHDKIAEAAVLLAEYGGVPEFLACHGYAPGGKNPRNALASRQHPQTGARSGKQTGSEGASAQDESSPPQARTEHS